MILLFSVSILSWTLIVQNTLNIAKIRKQLNIFEAKFDMNADLNKLYDYLSAKKAPSSGIERVFRLGFREFLRLYKQDAEPSVVLEGADRAMRIGLSKEEAKLEDSLPFLATVGSISVYVGLFGTVWGIMTAFRALGQMQQATLAMVAPGISEALIATALGLFAAIPAVYAYNRFSQHVQKIMRSYDNLAEEFTGILHRRLHTPSAEDKQ